MKTIKKVLGFSLYIFVILILAYLLSRFVVKRTGVDGHSMEETLHDGDQLLVDQLSYRFHEPERFDIIVFPNMGTQGNLVKRIVGLPGEEVRIDEAGVIYINETPLTEHFGKEPIKDPGLAARTVKLHDGEFFVLGDNRNDSLDSRSADVGIVYEQNIIGKVWIRLLPLRRFGKVA